MNALKNSVMEKSYWREGEFDRADTSAKKAVVFSS